MAKRKKQEPQKQQCSVPMQLTFNTHVTVEASSIEEAESLADACQWVNAGMNGAEMIDWDRQGPAQLDR